MKGSQGRCFGVGRILNQLLNQILVPYQVTGYYNAFGHAGNLFLTLNAGPIAY